MYDAAGQFDEFIDIGKLSKPVYVEFLTELPVAANSVRSDEGQEIPSSQPLASTGVLAQGGTLTRFDTLESIVAPDDPEHGRYLTFKNGLLPVDKQNHIYFDDIATPKVITEFQPYQDKVTDAGFIRVDTNGSWWWKYAVNVKADSASYWTFQDETGDT